MGKSRASKEMMGMMISDKKKAPPRKAPPKKTPVDDMSQYSDVGGLNYNPKKVKPKKR